MVLVSHGWTKRYVVGFYFDEPSVLLIQKLRPEWQKGMLNGIGGKVESYETPLEAMVREFKEETSVSVVASRWDYFCKIESAERSVFFYRADLNHGDPPVRDVTDEVLHWRRTIHLVGSVPNLHWLIPMAIHMNNHDWPYSVREQAK